MLIEGLYLTGSVALGEFRPHTSDIDFVAITATRPSGASLAALARAHRSLQALYPSLAFEGVYLAWDDLKRDPAKMDAAPAAFGGRFHHTHTAGFALNPVTWHTLAKQGVACRGPAVTSLDIWADPHTLAVWTRANLDSYWRRWHERHARLFSREGVMGLGSAAPAWGVLGVSRLHYTLTTGAITSKEGAGRYALERFPEQWHRIIHECLRIRRGETRRSLYGSPWTRRREALAFIAMVIDETHRVFHAHASA